MERSLIIIWGGIATYIYGYGFYISAKYHDSIFDSPLHWVIVDIITLVAVYYWSEHGYEFGCKSSPDAFLMIVFIVTVIGVLNLFIPGIATLVGGFTPLNLAMAIGCGYHTINEASDGKL